jgi:hypothetical protein
MMKNYLQKRWTKGVFIFSIIASLFTSLWMNQLPVKAEGPADPAPYITPASPPAVKGKTSS